MEKFCTKCGAELIDGVCPNCVNAPEEPASESPAPEKIEDTAAISADEQVVEAQKPEPAAQQAEQVSNQSEQVPQQPQIAAPVAQVKEAQPSKFYYTFKQVGHIFKHFFSKHTVDAISAQFDEKLPVWLILMPLFALISAVSMTLSFDGSRGLSIGAGSIFSGMSLSYLEIFIISFAMSLAIELVYSIAVMVYLRLMKTKCDFKSAANLTMSAYIAVALIDLFNIITIGTLNSESTAISSFGMIAFVVLLYIGVTRVLSGKKPFWSFFLMLVSASLVAMIAALVVCCPIIVMRGLQELASAITWK